MDCYVRSFDEIDREKMHSAGGKGASLAYLYKNHYPVPEGFVVFPSSFQDHRLLTEAWVEVQKYVEKMTNSAKTSLLFAVRSSAYAEDSFRASFAGGFETVLNVQTVEEIWQAIHTVYKSQGSDRVRSYSRANGLDSNHRMAVVVQLMIPSEISGVLFTVDPISGNREMMSGSFVYGLGEKLVAGEVSGKSFVVRRPRGIYEGPDEVEKVISDLFQFALRLERELGVPQDIEWAAHGGKVYILQARPITTLAFLNSGSTGRNDSLKGDYLWSNVNFGEAMPSVMTPFTASALEMGPLGNMITFQGISSYGNIAGRPYINISVFASIFRLWGKTNKQILEELDNLLHISIPEGTDIPLIPASKRTLFKILPTLIALNVRQRKEVRQLPDFLSRNQAFCTGMREEIREAGTSAQLLTIWTDNIKPHLLWIWSAVLSSASHASGLSASLKKELIKKVGADDADALLAGSNTDTEFLASLGPIIGLSKINSGEMTKEEYMDLYGHRGPNELELSLPRPYEDPQWIDKQLADYSSSIRDVKSRLCDQRDKYDEALRKFVLRYPREAQSVVRKINEVSKRTRLREETRSEYVRVFSLWRHWLVKAGEVTGVKRDIFYLTFDEVLNLLDGKEEGLQLIEARTKTYARYQSLPPYPSVINGRFDPFRWASDPDRRYDFFDAHASVVFSSTNIITGAAGSAGYAEGVVRRLDNPEDGCELKQDEILVAPQTNIGWTLLFPKAAAIVTDVGAPLSHAAIVARELGIPAVVGCGNATMKLRSGDRVRVDGSRGIVEIVKPSDT